VVRDQSARLNTLNTLNPFFTKFPIDILIGNFMEKPFRVFRVFRTRFGREERRELEPERRGTLPNHCTPAPR
jgi:hypothetical protein